MSVTGGKEEAMPISLRIPESTQKLIQKAASKAGKTKTALILEAVHEKLGVVKSREELVRATAGWLSREDARKLRDSVEIFGEIDEEEWR